VPAAEHRDREVDLGGTEGHHDRTADPGGAIRCTGMSDLVRITDVSPRDGLQNEPSPVPTPDKVRLVRALGATGVDEIEVASFVSPKWIPQLADGIELLRQLRDAPPPNAAQASSTESPASSPRPPAPSPRPPASSPRPLLSALVPNLRGMDAAAAAIDEGCPLDKIAVFTAASETFSQRNTNASIRETLDRFRPVVALARARSLTVRGYISCAIACPFEGTIEPGKVTDVMLRLLDIGVDEIDLGDTIGAAEPDSIIALLGAVEMALLSVERAGGGGNGGPLLTLHLHDTRGGAAECVKTALGLGVRSFDGAAAGLGGCPYASKPGPGGRAPGNIATETLVRTVREAGYETGVDECALAAAGAVAREVLEKAATRQSSKAANEESATGGGA
jgi:hydroxymethylglutaryl-CoA lyase